MATACPGRAAPRAFPRPSGGARVDSPLDRGNRFSIKIQRFWTGRKGACGDQKAIPYGMLVDDEYGPAGRERRSRDGRGLSSCLWYEPGRECGDSGGQMPMRSRKGQGRAQSASGPAAKRGPRRVLGVDAAPYYASTTPPYTPQPISSLDSRWADREYLLLPPDSSTLSGVATVGFHRCPMSRPEPFRTLQGRRHTFTATLPRPLPMLRQGYRDSSVDSS